MPIRFLASCLFTVVASAFAQQGASPYPNMAPIAQYQIADRDTEIALARSAAPPSIARDAEVRVLGAKNYEVAVAGKNKFVCLVERSWAKDSTDPEFWNPKLRAPNCFNQAAARSYLPMYLKKTEWALAGSSRQEIADRMKSAFDNGQFTPPTPDAMTYMMSKQGYLNDAVAHWHPHIMFYSPIADDSTWTAGADDAPVATVSSQEQHLSIINVPIARWSDGSPDSMKHGS